MPRFFGEVAERLKVPVLKTGVARATVGSNPTLSSTYTRFNESAKLNINKNAQNLINHSSSACYSASYDLEFFNIPKCAMTTMRIALDTKWVPRNSLPSSRHTFCILRNPIDRFVSAYNAIVCQQCDGDETNRDKVWYQEIISRVRKAENSITDRAFVYLNEIQRNGFFDSHHFPQSYFISDMYGRKEGMLDYAIDFSNLGSDLLRIPSIKKAGLRKKHLNRTFWWELAKKDLTGLQVEIIKDLYAQDYELLRRWGLDD